MTESPDDIVGHKTFDTGELGESGFPVLRHEPLTRAEADALWDACERAREDRAARVIIYLTNHAHNVVAPA